MRRAAVIFGGISGFISVASIVATLPYVRHGNLHKADAIGWASIILSALVVFFGIRSYREKEGGGRLTFGRGFLAGVLISLVSSVVFMAAFEAVYFGLVPEYGERYEACMIERAQESGGTPEELETHPTRNVLTSALATRLAFAQVELKRSVIGDGDSLLLCSDGLTTMLSDTEITERLRAPGRLEDLCGRLVRDANTRGGYDNISVVLVRVEDASTADDDEETRSLPASR